jgi:hypothetical protein
MTLENWVQIAPYRVNAEPSIADIWFRNNGTNNFKFIVRKSGSPEWNIVLSIHEDDDFSEIIAGPYDSLEAAKVAYTMLLVAEGEN